jgi:uncharacterized OB-fold protein
MAPFFAAARAGVLMLQQCRSCGRHRFPAAELCSACLVPALDWVAASGSAELFSYVIVHHAVDPYFAARVPYVVADVKLAEGPHMTTTVVGIPVSRLEIGMQLRVEFEHVAADVHLPVFRPVEC